MIENSIDNVGHPLTTCTITLHRLLQYTLDYISHHPLHWLHTQMNAMITPQTQWNPIRHTLYTLDFLFQIAEYHLAIVTVIATSRSLSLKFSLSSLVKVLPVFSYFWFSPVFLWFLNPLPCRFDTFCPSPDFCSCLQIISFVKPSGYC